VLSSGVATVLRFVGFVLTIWGLWKSAGGMRVVVSGRLDERSSAAKSLWIGLPLLAVGLGLLVLGSWLAARGGV